MLILIAIAVVGVSIRALRRRRSDRREQEHVDAYLETIDLLLASLRAGYSLAQSVLLLADVAPLAVRPKFQGIAIGVEQGRLITSELRDALTRFDPVFRPLFEVVSSSMLLGIPTETSIVQIQMEGRQVRRQRGEALARQLSVRLTLPVVLCLLPSFLFLIIVPMVMGTLTELQLDGGPP